MSMKRKSIGNIKIIVLIAVILVACAAIVVALMSGSDEKEPEIDVSTTLERVVEISKLSAYSCKYNGVVEVMNEKNENKRDFYAAYEAKVNIGVDFEKIEIIVDDSDASITIRIPTVRVNEVTVNMDTLDFLFDNDKADDIDARARAYKAALEDVTKEAENSNQLLESAQKGVQNFVRGLVEPIVLQMDKKYTLIIEEG